MTDKEHNEINELKQEIIQTQKNVKKNQKDLKEKIENGWLDDFDEVIENNPDYFNKTFVQINPYPEIDKIDKKKTNKFLNFIKKIM